MYTHGLEHLKGKAKAYGLSNAVPTHSDGQAFVLQGSLKVFHCLLNRYQVLKRVGTWWWCLYQHAFSKAGSDAMFGGAL